MLFSVVIKKSGVFLILIFAAVIVFNSVKAQGSKPKFKVIAFYTGKEDKAHISFVHEANRWFPKMAARYNFSYDSTSNWKNMNAAFLSHYQVVLFLDTRPEDPAARLAFEKYMKSGGAWMGFHFSAFALTPSDVPANWNWYHNVFLGSGQYVSNTWHPTPATLNIDTNFPATQNMPKQFTTAPNEWYRWEFDLLKNPNIKILASIDSSSFPLGNGPKQSEIWHSGFYPVVWTNIRYKMIYMNMGHNDIDYDNHTDKELSFSLANEMEAKLILDSLLWLGANDKM